MPKGSGKPIPKIKIDLKPSSAQVEELLITLRERFHKHMDRHPDIKWETVQKRLDKEKLKSLHAMEQTGGEPDVIGIEEGAYLFVDCSKQSPDRRKICYDREGEKEREKKGVYPAGNAVDLAAKMGVELLDEAQYRMLQQLGEFDTKTESWLKTPSDIRELGGAIFGDRRYGRVFVFHNSAKSFYSGRGFRSLLRV